MATPRAPADEASSSLRDARLGASLPARTWFQLALALAMVLAMLVGTAGEPALAFEAPAGDHTQGGVEEDHASGRCRGPLGGHEVVAEAESRDELEERGDPPGAGVLLAAPDQAAAIEATRRGSSRHVVGSQRGRRLGFGRGPPARV